MRRLAAWIGLAAMAAGCATPPPPSQVGAWLASGRPVPPPQDACPGVADLDLAAIERDDQAYAATHPPVAPDAALVVLPASAEALVPADAVVVIRAHMPPGGFYRSDVKSMVWKTADGDWRVWRQTKDYEAPEPSPPGPSGSPEYAAWDAERRRPKTDEERWPPETGPLNAETAARLEAALADPCRAWDPAFYPWEQPLRRPEYGMDRRRCPPDGSSYRADIIEPGRPRRGIGASCINDTPTFHLISLTAYARPQS